MEISYYGGEKEKYGCAKEGEYRNAKKKSPYT